MGDLQAIQIARVIISFWALEGLILVLMGFGIIPIRETNDISIVPIFYLKSFEFPLEPYCIVLGIVNIIGVLSQWGYTPVGKIIGRLALMMHAALKLYAYKAIGESVLPQILSIIALSSFSFLERNEIKAETIVKVSFILIAFDGLMKLLMGFGMIPPSESDTIVSTFYLKPFQLPLEPYFIVFGIVNVIGYLSQWGYTPVPKVIGRLGLMLNEVLSLYARKTIGENIKGEMLMITFLSSLFILEKKEEELENYFPRIVSDKAQGCAFLCGILGLNFLGPKYAVFLACFGWYQAKNNENNLGIYCRKMGDFVNFICISLWYDGSNSTAALVGGILGFVEGGLPSAIIFSSLSWHYAKNGWLWDESNNARGAAWAGGIIGYYISGLFYGCIFAWIACHCAENYWNKAGEFCRIIGAFTNLVGGSIFRAWNRASGE